MKKMKHWYWPALLYHSSNLTEPSILKTSKPLFSKILIHYIGHYSPLTKNLNLISWYSVVNPNKLCIWTKYDWVVSKIPNHGSSSRLIQFNEPCNMPLNMFIKGPTKLQTNCLAYFIFRNQTWSLKVKQCKA
jgi:hypothetical protein